VNLGDHPLAVLIAHMAAPDDDLIAHFSVEVMDELLEMQATA